MAVVLPIPEPSNFTNWNRSLQGAYRKGVLAQIEGKSLRDCPYEDKRKPSGRLSWSRSYISAWNDGFSDSERHHEREAARAVEVSAAEAQAVGVVQIEDANDHRESGPQWDAWSQEAESLAGLAPSEVQLLHLESCYRAG